MDSRSLSRAMSSGISDVALECVMAYIDDPCDRGAISLVCKKWHSVDALTRKHVTIALCYATSPSRLRRRFPILESLKLKGKPRAAMFFNLMPEDWGGYAGPWVDEISGNFVCLKSIHFRRMIVRDADLQALARARGHMLQVLKLDQCSGFSTDGLFQVTRSCRCLQTLFLQGSSINEKDGEWLHELALSNTVLETLNFYLTELRLINIQDLELIAKNCSSLISLKISDCEILDLVGFFQSAKLLEEFGGGSFNDEAGKGNKYEDVPLPPRLSGLGLNYMGKNEMHVIYPFATSLKKLDLQYTFLDTEDHCQLLQRCPNLEVLEARDVIGDRGLEVVAQHCRKLRRLRIEHGEDEQGLEDEQGMVSHRGVSALTRGCPELEFLAVYVSDITNAALESIGTLSKNLCDFRLVLTGNEERITDLPLDNGVLALLRGCQKIRRFALCLRPGGLTDVGLGYIGRHGINIRWMLLSYVGKTDSGLLECSRGCPNLRKLEIRGCSFSERALALAVMQLASLRFLWLQGYNASATGSDLLAMVRPFWNIEFVLPRLVMNEFGGPGGAGVVEQPTQILAYCSLDGQRMDFPGTVVPLYPSPQRCSQVYIFFFFMIMGVELAAKAKILDNINCFNYLKQTQIIYSATKELSAGSGFHYYNLNFCYSHPASCQN